MKTLILPGANPSTIQWFEGLTQKLGISGESTTVHRYAFWSGQNDQKDISTEVALLPPDPFDLIMAKSIGSMVLLHGIKEQKLQFKKALIIGIPLDIAPETGFDSEALKLLSDESIFVVQQKNDKLGAASGLTGYNPANLLIIDGSNHLYNGFDLYVPQCIKWLS